MQAGEGPLIGAAALDVVLLTLVEARQRSLNGLRRGDFFLFRQRIELKFGIRIGKDAQFLCISNP